MAVTTGTKSATVSTYGITTSAAFDDLQTPGLTHGPEVTISIPAATGNALVILTAQVYVKNSTYNHGFMSFEVVNDARYSAAKERSLEVVSFDDRPNMGAAIRASATYFVSGLTRGNILLLQSMQWKILA
jgi:hypothetical protein